MGVGLSVIGLVAVDEENDGYVQWVNASGGKLFGLVPYDRLHYRIGESAVESLIWCVPRALYLPFYVSWQLFLKFTFFSAGIGLYFFVMLIGFLLCWLIFFSLGDVTVTIDLLDTLLDIPITILNLIIFGVNSAYGMLRPMIPLFNSLVFNGARLFYTVGLEISSAIDTIADQVTQADDSLAGTYESTNMEFNNLRASRGTNRYGMLDNNATGGVALYDMLDNDATRAVAAGAYGLFVPCYRRLAYGLTMYEDPNCMSILGGDTFNSARMWAVNVMTNLAVLVLKVVGFLIRGLMWVILEGIFQVINFFTSGSAIQLIVWFIQEISAGLVNVATYMTNLSNYKKIFIAVSEFFGACIGGNIEKCILEPVTQLFDVFFVQSGARQGGSVAFTRAKHYMQHSRHLTTTNKTAYYADTPVQSEDIRDTLVGVMDNVLHGDVPGDTWCGAELLRVHKQLNNQTIKRLDDLGYGEQWSFVACLTLFVMDSVSHVYTHTEPGTFLSPIKLLRAVAAMLNSTAPEWIRIETEINQFSANYGSTKSTVGRLFQTARHVGTTKDPMYLEYLDDDDNDSWDTNTRFLHNGAVSVMRSLRSLEKDISIVQTHNLKLRKSTKRETQRHHARKVQAYLRKTSDSIKNMVSTLEHKTEKPTKHNTRPWSTNMQFEESILAQNRKEYRKASEAEQERYIKVQKTRGELRRRSRAASSRDDPSNFLLRWIAETFVPNREGGVPLWNILNPSQTINRILDTPYCWQNVDFSCNYQVFGDDAQNDDQYKDCKTSCADQQASELARGKFALEEVGAQTELCLADCENAREAEGGFFDWAVGGLANFFQMCWPPNRNGIPTTDERMSNETQCFPQMDELFHMEYFFFNLEQWLLETTMSENMNSVCGDYDLDVWEECSQRGMWVGTCFYVFDWIPIYLGVSKAFVNKLNNFLLGFQYAFGTLFLQLQSPDSQKRQDADLACFVLVGVWSLIWGFLIILLLIFVFVVFDTVSYALLNFILAPVYFVCTVFDLLPRLPTKANDPVYTLLLQQQKATKGGS